ncbi:hypothetical protein ACJX0J_028559 [Zea mays]
MPNVRFPFYPNFWSNTRSTGHLRLLIIDILSISLEEEDEEHASILSGKERLNEILEGHEKNCLVILTFLMKMMISDEQKGKKCWFLEMKEKQDEVEKRATTNAHEDDFPIQTCIAIVDGMEELSDDEKEEDCKNMICYMDKMQSLSSSSFTMFLYFATTLYSLFSSDTHL